jgi:DNA-binding transcriptional regulator YiaG
MSSPYPTTGAIAEDSPVHDWHLTLRAALAMVYDREAIGLLSDAALAQIDAIVAGRPDTLAAMMRDSSRPPGLRLRIFRAAEKLTQAALADRLGVHVNGLAAWERDERPPRLDETREVIESVTGIPAPDWQRAAP